MIMANAKTVSERIAQARKENGMTQTQLARKLNMSPQNVSKWERGESLPDAITLMTLAATLNKEIGFFYGERGSEGAEREQGKSRAVLNQSGSKWKGMDFSQTVMGCYDFKYARFENCNFAYADLSGNAMPYTEFVRCKMIGADFADCRLDRADFKGCDLAEANFTRAQLKQSDFADCAIGGAIFTGAKQDGTAYRGCRIENVVFTKQDFKSAIFKKTVFKNCVFNDCTFVDCDFKTAMFETCRADKVSHNFMLTCKAKTDGIEII